MNDWLKRRGWLVLKVALSVTVLTFCVLAGVVFWKDHQFRKTLETTPEPELCALCGDGEQMPWFHAPALIDLSTGEIGELRVYDYDIYNQREIAETQPDGVFSFFRCAGLTGTKGLPDQGCRVHLPEKAELMEPALFCRDCRALLSEATIWGYAVLDLYESESGTVRAYSAEEGAEHTIRDYTVSVVQDTEAGGPSLTVLGHYLPE